MSLFYFICALPHTPHTHHTHMHTITYPTHHTHMHTQLTVMESRCRSAVMDKEKLEEYLMELEREKKSNEKKAVKVMITRAIFFQD